MLAFAAGACTRLDFGDLRPFRLDPNVYALTAPAMFDRKQIVRRPIGPGDLVDGNGFCAGSAPLTPDTSLEPSLSDQVQLTRGVGLGMSECEVARALGTAQRVDIGANERGERTAAMTYMAADRAGIYQFVGGRLVSMERGPEPAPPPKGEKKPARKKPARRPANT
ncbi:MAG: hypothetical protein HY056_16245 [Proteobacteria bacterium]|nr:hypothetical protein [Pseudomonadota bacterium]